jgi:hypothetical protein
MAYFQIVKNIMAYFHLTLNTKTHKGKRTFKERKNNRSQYIPSQRGQPARPPPSPPPPGIHPHHAFTDFAGTPGREIERGGQKRKRNRPISSSFTASPPSSSSPAEISPFPPARDRRGASRNPRRLAGFAGRSPHASGVGPCSDSRVGEGDARGECSTSSSPAARI